jgi:hypothetical protein
VQVSRMPILTCWGFFILSSGGFYLSALVYTNIISVFEAFRCYYFLFLYYTAW